MFHAPTLSIMPKTHLTPKRNNKFLTPIPHSSKNSPLRNQSNTTIAYTIPSRQLRYSPCPQMLDIPPPRCLSKLHHSTPNKHIDALRTELLSFEPQCSLYHQLSSQKLPNWSVINQITPPLTKILFQT